jgi:general nucleoside transport system permease protein
MAEPALATSAGRSWRSRPPWLDALLSQVVAVGLAALLAGAIGGVIILLYHESPLFTYETIWRFGTNRPQDFARVLEGATPLIFSGLAVAVAFRAGMFNIGVEGQYIVGMATAAAAALGLRSLPAPLLLPLVVLAAMAGATAWAAVPALLKVRTGAHEVVTTIMMNGIAGSLVAWLLLHPLRTSQRGLIDLRTDIFARGALIPGIAQTFRLQDVIPPSVHLTWLFPAALLAAIGVWFLLRRMRLGYEARAVGSSPAAAQAGGIDVGRIQLTMFLISGALAGLVGLNDLLGNRGYLGANYVTNLGFDGIAVAFLGRNNPAGIVVAAVLIGILERGQDGVALLTNLPQEIIVILQGVLILSVVVAYEVVNRAGARRIQRLERAGEVHSPSADGMAA